MPEILEERGGSAKSGLMLALAKTQVLSAAGDDHPVFEYTFGHSMRLAFREGIRYVQNIEH
jgi:hypothetical protein